MRPSRRAPDYLALREEGAAPGFDLFNSPSSYAALARALRAGVVKTVMIGDSLGYGFEGPAANTAAQRLERWMRRLWPTQAHTFINRSIPGAKLTDFLNASYTPATGWGANTWPGRDVWSPNTDEEHSLRWPEGASNVSTVWKTLVSNDAPDFLLIGLLFNDVIVGARSLYQARTDLASLVTYVNGLAKVPTVVLITEHTGNSLNSNTTGFAHRKLRGINALMRAFALNNGWGVLDAGRLFDRAMFGRDPQRVKWDADRYLDSLTDATLWQRNFGGSDYTSNPVSNTGSSTVAVDSTGKHAGAATELWSRKTECNGVYARWTIRKLAANSDVMMLMLGSHAPDDDPVASTDKLFLKFYNSGANGVIDLVMDGNVLFTQNVALFPADDLSSAHVVVTFDGYKVRIWLTGNTNPHAPDIAWTGVAYAPSYPGIGYYNLSQAPAVKFTNMVFVAGAESPTAPQMVSQADYFGSSAAPYLTTNRPAGGDSPGSHPSTYGYQLLYEAALIPVLRAAGMAVAIQDVIPRATNGLHLLMLGCHAIGVTYFADASMTAILQTNVTNGNLELYINVGLTVGASFTPRLRLSLPVNSAETLRTLLEWADPGGTLRGAITTDTSGNCAIGLGAWHDGTVWKALHSTAILIFQNTTSAALEIYINTGLTAGNTFTPTKCFTLNKTGIVLPAGVAAAGGAPLKLTSGTFNTTGEAGAVEYNGSVLTFVRSGTTREAILTSAGGAASPSTASASPGLNRIGGATQWLGAPTDWLQVVKPDGTTLKVPGY